MVGRRSLRWRSVMQISLGSLLLGSRRWYRVKGLVVRWEGIDGKDMLTSGEAVSRVCWRAESACLVYRWEERLVRFVVAMKVGRSGHWRVGSVVSWLYAWRSKGAYVLYLERVGSDEMVHEAKREQIDAGRASLVLFVMSAPCVMAWSVLVKDINARGIVVSDGALRPSPPRASGRCAMRRARSWSAMVSVSESVM